MRNLWIAAALACGLVFGPLAAAKLPAPPAMSEADKAAKAAKDAATKAHDAELLGKAQDKAVANYKKNKGMGEPQPVSASASKKK
jgi:hypothetical protein